LKTLGDIFNGTDLSNIFSEEVQASSLSAPRISLEDLAKKTKLTEKKVRRLMDNVEEYWGLPGNVPPGIFSEDEARVRRLARQERLRRINEGSGKNGNENVKKNTFYEYKEDQIYLFCAELGLGSVVGNPDIQKGLALVIDAQNYAPKLKALIMQGGGMPENPTLWSKSNHERCKQVAKSMLAKEKGIKFSEVDDKEAEKRKQQIFELYQSAEMTKEDKEHWDKYIKNTPNSLEELAKEGAYELAPLFKSMNRRTSVIYQYSMDDYYNINQLLELFVIHERRRKAQEKQLEELSFLRDENTHNSKARAIHDIYVKLAEHVVDEAKKRNAQDTDLKDYVKNKVYPTTSFNRLKEKIKKQTLKEFGGVTRISRFDPRWVRDEEERKKRTKERGKTFEEFFADAMLEYSTGIRTINDLEKLKDYRIEEINEIEERNSKLENEMKELQELEEKLAEEHRARMIWLTKKAAITNEQAKITNHIIKQRYRENYEKMFFEYLPKECGKKFKNIRILSSLDITLAEETMPGHSRYKKGKLFDPGVSPDEAFHYVDIGGLTIALIPNPDFQRSNEPKEGDLRRIKMKFNDSLADAVSKHFSEEEARKTKYTRLSTADIIFTSWGAGGFEIQPQQAIGETWVDGEYRATPRRVVLIKGGPMHDSERVSNFGARWPVRTWAVKRKNKGGFQAGSLFYIDKGDGKPEFFFVDTSELAKMGSKYWKKYDGIKEQLKDKKLSKVKKKELNQQLKTILDKVKFNMQVDMLDDDEHRGCSTPKGRPSNEETIRATYANVVDSIGCPEHVKLTEMTHGSLAFRQFDTKKQGKPKTIAGIFDDLLYLKKAFEKGKINSEEFDIMKSLYIEEQESLRMKWKNAEQDELHIRGTKPFLEELMRDWNTKVLMGDGNHNVGEAGRLAQHYDIEFRRAGLLKLVNNPGEGNTYSQIWLNDKLKMDFYHKTFEGSTEISDVWKQIHGTRSDSSVVYTADRHQGGASVKGGKAVYLDFGHQPDNSYVHRIGKCASLRGSVVPIVPKDGRIIFGGKFVDDICNDPIMAWDIKSRILEKAYHLIKSYREPEARKKITIMSEARKKMKSESLY
jgi:hypothetical protein